MTIGLFFGSFNPVHNGHMMIANYMVEYAGLNQVWFIVSPQNPFKQKKNLLDNYHRFYLTELAIQKDHRFVTSNIEFNMPKPSYTTHTLAYLRDKHPTYEFRLIMGADQLPSFYKWKNHEEIIKNYTRIIYPRPGISKEEILKHPNIQLVNAPQIEISASFIRKAIKENKDIRFFLPPGVYEYILEMKFYQ